MSLFPGTAATGGRGKRGAGKVQGVGSTFPAECGLADGGDSALSTAVWQSQNGQPVVGEPAGGGSQRKTGRSHH